jgi:periplasmic protein TonB
VVFANLRSDERIGLGIALGLHLALVAVLLVRPAPKPAYEPAERMTVNLATDVGLEATAPDPVRESRAAVAPVLAPEPAPAPEPVAEPQPQPQPQPIVQPRPEPPRPVATTPPRPKPVPRATAQPRPRPTTASTEPRRRPDTPSTRAQSTPAPRKPAGGSRIGADFLPGAGDSTTTRESRVPASQIGASAKASLFQAVARQLKPHWQPPSGPDVEEIVTKVRFRLNPNGSLAGRPEMVGQRGITDLNRAQASRHSEQAVRAIQLAAPFDLPDEYYDAWKVITVDFDWKLSQ